MTELTWLQHGDSFSLWVLGVQSCLTLCDPLYYSLPGSSVYGILQVKILEWVAIPFCRESSRPRDLTQVSCIARRLLIVRITSLPFEGRSKLQEAELQKKEMNLHCAPTVWPTPCSSVYTDSHCISSAPLKSRFDVLWYLIVPKALESINVY